MSTPTRRLGRTVRMLAVACLTLTLASPAAAQFGSLKKKAQQAAGAEAARKAGDTTGAQGGAAPAPVAGGGAAETVVLDEQLVDQLIAGLKAGQADRAAAKKENTPYGRYHRDQAAYEAAQVSCAEGQRTFPTRASADEKFMKRYSDYTDKMVKAQEAGDNRLVQAYSDSAMAMQDPGCVVKQPTQPSDYYEAQRKVDSGAEEDAIKASRLSRSEFAMAQERAWMILQGRTPPGDASAGEKSAVNKRSAELKPLLGLQEQAPARAAKPAPAPAPAPAAAAPAGMSADQSRTANCMAANAQKHQKEIESLGQRAQAAAQANDMAKTMAIADTIRQLQSAGCQ